MGNLAPGGGGRAHVRRLGGAEGSAVGAELLDGRERAELRLVESGGSGAAAAAADEAESPEETASWLCRVLFTWAFPVLWTGYQRGHTELADLPPVPSGDRPLAVEAQVRDAWARHCASSATGGRPRLVRVLFNVTRPLFVPTLCLHLTQMITSYAQPVMLHRLLTELDASQAHDTGDSILITANAVGIALLVMGFWVLAEYVWTRYVRCDLCAQIALTHLTYRKSLYLAGGSKTTLALGDLQNHFSTDATKPAQTFMHFSHAQVMEAAITICVVAWHLTTLIGSAGFVGMVTVAAFAPIQLMATRRIKMLVRRIQQCRDHRGRLCSQFLSAMRVVKCFRLEDTALKQIEVVREEELQWQWGKRIIYPFQNFMGATASLFGSIASFTWLLLVLDRPLEPAVAFTVLTWMNLLKSSVMSVPNSFAQILDCYVGVRRIEALLHADCDVGDAWLDLGDGLGGSGGGATMNTWTEETEGLTVGPLPDFRLRSCSLGWALSGGQGFAGAKELTFDVKRGELVLVCGPIGSGKSALLEGLAGTRPPLRGQLIPPGRSLAYVAQRPWLLNGTLLENVLFGSPLQEQRLQEAVDCCALGPDLAALPAGFSTPVGEEGVQLSGGQKQRTSLARAVYSGAEVILLDDVLSALDAHVGRHVFEEAICKALAGKTRVMATHQVQYCSHPSVDRILVLAPDGTMQHWGTFTDLSRQGVDLGACGLEEPTGEEPVAEDGKEADAADGAATPRAAPPDTPRCSATGSESAGRRHLAGGASNETRRYGAVRRADFLAYAHACGGLKSIAMIVVLMAAYYGSLLGSNLLLAAWSNANDVAKTTGSADRRTDDEEAYLAKYLAYSIMSGLSCFAFLFGIQIAALKGAKTLYTNLMVGLLSTDLRFFDLTPTGRALNRCLADTQLIDDVMPFAFRMVIESIMNFVISVVILSMFAWEALFALPPFAVAYWRIMSIYRWPARDIKRIQSTSRSPAMSHFADTIRGATTIRAYKHDRRFMRENLQLLGTIQLTGYWFWVAQGWVSMVQEMLGTVLLAVVAGVIGYRASTGALSPGLAGLALSYAMSMPRDLMWLSRRIANLEVEFVAVERVLEYVRLPSEEAAHAETNACPVLDLSPSDAVLRVVGNGCRKAVAVTAEDVRLRYGQDGPWVLTGLSLEVSTGSRVAVVGRTGCGKSSLLSALVRLYPVADVGRLSVHGFDVLRTPLAALRDTVRVLLQDPIFFSGTVRSNLLCQPPPATALFPGGQASAAALRVAAGCVPSAREDEALWRALEQAGLGQRLQALPDGLDTRVEEAGQNFSQGERQLLCLARVLVDKPALNGCANGANASVGVNTLGPRVLLCDEPTAACDLATDEHIHHTLLQGLPADWTLIVVCHRLHRIREFDHVFVFDGGKVAESGPPAELLGAPSGRGLPGGAGLLAEMCRQQCVS